jgi:hypothetical protein
LRSVSKCDALSILTLLVTPYAWTSAFAGLKGIDLRSMRDADAFLTALLASFFDPPLLVTSNA